MPSAKVNSIFINSLPRKSREISENPEIKRLQTPEFEISVFAKLFTIFTGYKKKNQSKKL